MSYHAPTRLDDALGILGRGDVQVVAGCTDYFPARGTAPERRPLLDVTGVSEMQGITPVDAGLWIGGAVTWSQIAAAQMPASCAGLQAAARVVGSVQIQNAGTIAGNLCHASPAADGVPPLLALDATVSLAGPRGARKLALQDFLLGPRQTALASDELLVGVTLNLPPPHTKAAFEKLGSRRYLVISYVMTAVVIGVDTRDLIDHARVAVGACSPVARRLPALEAALIGQRPDVATVAPGFLTDLTPITDIRADADYRLAAAAEQIRRAIATAGGLA